MVASHHYDSEYVPSRDEVVWISFDPQAGVEIMKRRPALILSSRAFNEQQGMALICPITHTNQRNAFTVEVPNELHGTLQGVIRADQVKCLDWRARNAAFLCQMSEQTAVEVARLVETILWD